MAILSSKPAPQTLIKILGIDQSLNSTGKCLHTIKTYEGATRSQYKYWIIPSKMTEKMRKFSNKYITISPYEKQVGEDYTSKEMAKTHNIYDICNIIKEIIKKDKPNVICMEGISYGSIGGASVIDLAGLNYCIRMLAIEYGITLQLVSPKTLKKLATGNAGALKDEMVWAWKECDPHMKDIQDIKVDDLADAFFLSKSYNVH